MSGGNVFEYGQKETEFLKSKDVRLARVIEQIGHIERPVNIDLFAAVVKSIIGQQISTKAQATIWQRCQDSLGQINANSLAETPLTELQAFGMSFRKAEYIKEFALKVENRELDLESMHKMPDSEVITMLLSLRGVGLWTAEMILLFCLQRPNILSFGDLAIHRGMRMVYRHKEIGKARFEMYRKRFSPYCSVASLYFWEVSGGAIPELHDRARALPAK